MSRTQTWKVRRGPQNEDDRDVAVPLRDGTKIYVDVFQPESFEGKLLILMTCSPYGKQGPKTFAIFPNMECLRVRSPITPFGKAQIPFTGPRVDTPSSTPTPAVHGAEGDCEILGPQEGQDGYDVVEWLAHLPWSNGRVGLCGVPIFPSRSGVSQNSTHLI